MTDHRFTVDDVIKALECLSGAEIFCRECAFGHLEDHGFACKKNVANAALALINRQKAEIERLEELAAEKQNLTEQWQNKVGELLAEKQIIEAEAIKEFAERLNREAFLYQTDDYAFQVVATKRIDILVKEMTEEQK